MIILHFIRIHWLIFYFQIIVQFILFLIHQSFRIEINFKKKQEQ